MKVALRKVKATQSVFVTLLVPGSVALQPSSRGISLLGKVGGSREQCPVKTNVVADRSEFVCESLCEIIADRDVLDAPLLQQTTPGPTLRRAGDLLSIQKNIGPNWIREAQLSIVATALWAVLARFCILNRTCHRRVATAIHDLPDRPQNITQCSMDFFVDRR